MATEKERSNLDRVMDEITALGEFTPEYHEMMGHLFTVLARREWLTAEQIRRSVAAREKRTAVKASSSSSTAPARKKPGRPKKTAQSQAGASGSIPPLQEDDLKALG